MNSCFALNRDVYFKIGLKHSLKENQLEQQKTNYFSKKSQDGQTSHVIRLSLHIAFKAHEEEFKQSQS